MKLWKENRTDQEWEMSPETITDEFIVSKWHELYKQGWPIERAISGFITDKDGLNSVCDTEDFQKLIKYVFRNMPQRIKAKMILGILKTTHKE